MPTSGLLALRAGVADIGALCKIKPDTGVVVMFGGEVGGGISDFPICVVYNFRLCFETYRH